MDMWYYSGRPPVIAIFADLIPPPTPAVLHTHIGAGRAMFPAQQQGMKMCGLKSVSGSEAGGGGKHIREDGKSI